MKVLLVNTPYSGSIPGIWNRMFPPLPILHLASALKARMPEVECRVFDGLYHGAKSTMRAIEKESPDVLGLSFLSFVASDAYRLIDWAKTSRPAMKVIVGGTHVTALPMDAFEKSKADVAVIGEGEETFPHLISALRDGADPSSVPGTYWRLDGEILKNALRPPIEQVDTIPPPARELVNIREYSGVYVSKKGWNTHILSSRGCINHCAFCARIVWKLQKPYLRLRSPERVAREVADLNARFGLEEFFDMADELNSDLAWSTAVCEEYRKLRHPMAWQCFLRARPFSEKLVDDIAASGCWLVHLGIESGNQETLDGIGKNITIEEVERACGWMKGRGLKVVGLFMLFNFWGKDGELKFEDARKSLHTLEFARSLLKRGLVDSITCSPALPYPGSRIYDVAMKHGVIDKKHFGSWQEWDHGWQSVARLPGVTQRDFLRVKMKGIALQSLALFKMREINVSSAIFTRAWGAVKMAFRMAAQEGKSLVGMREGRSKETPADGD